MTKILLVEDEETIVRSLKDFLRAEGFDVDNTDGQKNALEMLERSDYDLALLDVSLSEGNGFFALLGNQEGKTASCYIFDGIRG